MKTLMQLLSETEKLFGEKDYKPTETYLFTLGRTPSGWRFSVVNSWGKWWDAGLITDFGPYSTPDIAVSEFLRYVKLNNIDVKSLVE